MHDIWIWNIYHDNMLLVKEVYDSISKFEEVVDSSLYKVTWNLLVPLKTSMFA